MTTSSTPGNLAPGNDAAPGSQAPYAKTLTPGHDPDGGKYRGKAGFDAHVRRIAAVDLQQRAVPFPLRRIPLLLRIHPPGSDGPHRLCHPLFALLLLQVERHLLPAARLRFGERLLDRPCHLQSTDATGEILARGIERIGQSGHVGLFQVHEFPDRNRQQPLRTRVPQLPEHLPAGRYFVLRVPVDELYDRHLPGTTQTPEQLGRLPVLSLVLPTTGSRPDRPGQRLHSPDPTKPAAGHARNVRHGRIPDPDRLIQKKPSFRTISHSTSSIVSSTSRCSTPGSNA